jgi:Protein of unknown function (DUF2878)
VTFICYGVNSRLTPLCNMKYTIHVIYYYIIWSICILGAAKQLYLPTYLLAFAMLALHGLWQRRYQPLRLALWIWLALLASVGFIIDTLLIQLHVIRFQALQHQLSPLWMIILWLDFGLLFFSVLSDYFRRYLILGCLSLPGFSIAYAVGARFGAAQLLLPHTALLVGVIWALLLPLCLWVYNCILDNQGIAYD